MLPPKALYGEPARRQEWPPLVELDQLGRLSCEGKTFYDPARDHKDLDSIAKLRERLSAEARRRGLVAPLDAAAPAAPAARKQELVGAPLRILCDKWTEWFWIQMFVQAFAGDESPVWQIELAVSEVDREAELVRGK